jgi:hypothetical protein
MKRIRAKNGAAVWTGGGRRRKGRGARCRKQCEVLFWNIVIVVKGSFSNTNVRDSDIGVSSPSFWTESLTASRAYAGSVGRRRRS